MTYAHTYRYELSSKIDWGHLLRHRPAGVSYIRVLSKWVIFRNYSSVFVAQMDTSWFRGHGHAVELGLALIQPQRPWKMQVDSTRPAVWTASYRVAGAPKDVQAPSTHWDKRPPIVEVCRSLAAMVETSDAARRLGFNPYTASVE